MSLKIILDVISITNLVSIFAKIFYKPSIFTGDDALLHFVSQNSHFIERIYSLLNFTYIFKQHMYRQFCHFNSYFLNKRYQLLFWFS